MAKIREALAGFAQRQQKNAKYFFFGPLLLMATGGVLAAVLPQLMGMTLVIIWLVLGGSVAVFYALFSAYIGEYEKRTGIYCFKGACCLFLFFLGMDSLLCLQRVLRTHALTVPALLAGCLFVLLFFAYCASESGKTLFEKLRDQEGAGLVAGKKEFTQGDVVLCNVKSELDAGVKDAREILPYKDRFLHMLILGVTGTGKTSQIIIPMIHQDIQNQEAGIIVMEPKGDLAQKVMVMCQYYGRSAKYFDPAMDDCPKFNPLFGREMDVVENVATTFRMLNPDSPTFFLDLNEQLIRNAVKVLKRLDKYEGIEGKNANLIWLSRLLQNSGGQGRDIIQRFSKIAARTDSEAKENADIASWFMNDYFPERSKVYENTSGVRSQVAKICSNEFLREVLNPDVMNGERNDIDFDAAMANGEVICISTAQGSLRGLSQFLGYFLILQLQSAVFRRPGNENTRRACFLYIDEFQVYANKGFGDMLTMGRSYRVASHLATQARSQMAMGSGREGQSFVNLVSSNARNVVIYPGCSFDDAKYYSNQFGEYEKTETMVGVSRKRFNPITGGLAPLGHPTESVREQKKMTPVFSPTEIMQRPFGEITYAIIKNNSVQPAKVGKISYIDSKLNAELDRMIEEHNRAHLRKTEDELYEEQKAKANGGVVWENSDTFTEGTEIDDPMGGAGMEGVGATDTPDSTIIRDIPDVEVHEAEKEAEKLHPAIIEDGLFQEQPPEELDFDPLDDSGNIFDGLVEDAF